MLAAVAVLASCFSLDRKAKPTPTQLASWIKIWIPPEVSKYSASAAGALDWEVVARFDIPRHRIATFLEKSALVAEGAGEPGPGRLRPKKSVRRYYRPWGEPPSFEVWAEIEADEDPATVVILARDY